VRGAAWWADAEVADGWAAAAKAIQDANAAASAVRRAAPDAPPPPRPSRLYVTPAKLTAALSSPVLVPDGEAHGDAVPAPPRIADLIRDARSALAQGRAVVMATPGTAVL
jgi:hypothetical protein